MKGTKMQLKDRILAIDYGTKRTGIAISDPLGQIATPQPHIPMKTNEHLCNDIINIISDYKIKKIILGLPLRTDGKAGDTEAKVKEFHELLSEKIEIPIEFVCEAFTTVIAAQKLHEKGKNAKQQRQIIDSAAAAVMLQGYLDSHN